MMMTNFRFLTIIFSLAIIAAVLTGSAIAVAPSPEAIEKWRTEGILEEKMANLKAFKQAGGCTAEEGLLFDRKSRALQLSLDADAVDTVRVIVILVDFEDWPYTAQGVAALPVDFDSLLFSDREIDAIFNDGGSMTDYYKENSYGQFYLVGDIYGWYRMPMDYADYVGSDDGLTMGSTLALHAVQAAEANSVDFSKYDRDFNGRCDGVIIVHAGAGAEEGNYGIWSHKSTIPGSPVYDGVTLSAYTMNPEESQGHISPIGVFCHEYGHFLGLPDLYDVDYTPASSDGVGKWSLMASGNYLGQSRKPAHLDGWSKIAIPFLLPTVVSTNIFQAPIPEVISEPVIYKLQYSSSEYWIVENRQKKGFDINLPNSGLCIYHVDLNAPANNTNYLRYYVALEQADGNNDLALTQFNTGDAGDSWPGASANRNFTDQSVPNTRTNFDAVTGVGVWNITNSDSIMYADLDVSFSRPWPVLAGPDSVIFDDSPTGGDGDGYIEAGETINFHCRVKNLMRTGYNLRASLSSNNPDITFITDNVSFGTNFDGTPASNLIPIVFEVADELIPIIDSVFLTITSDSLAAGGGSENYSQTFGLEVSLGAPQILVVDDDQGDDYQEIFRDLIYKRRIPHSIFNAQSASPTAAELGQYPMVFWHTGKVASGALAALDVAAIKGYLNDYNGKIFVSGFSAVGDIKAADPTLLTDYLHVNSSTTSNFFSFIGHNDNPISTGTKYRYNSVVPSFVPFAVLEPINGAQAAFAVEFAPNVVSPTTVGATFSGDYKTVLITFPFEYISSDFALTGYSPPDTLMNRILEFFGGIPTSVYDGSPFAALPNSFDLYHNYPNPFNPSTSISYTLRADKSDNGRPAKTELTIYNALGQRVKKLVDKVQLPGNYTVEWQGDTDSGNKVSSGVYFYRLTRGTDNDTKKMVLLK